MFNIYNNLMVLSFAKSVPDLMDNIKLEQI
jgi:hypothetical protein